MLKIDFGPHHLKGDSCLSSGAGFVLLSIFPFPNILFYLWTRFDTLVHADFWASNILFQYDAENQPSNAVMVDFQHVGIGDPIRDIFSLIYSSTTSSFRFKHMEMLLRGYFSQFQKYFTGYCFMSRCNFDMFYENCLSYRKFGFVWGLYITSVGKRLK